MPGVLKRARSSRWQPFLEGNNGQFGGRSQRQFPATASGRLRVLAIQLADLVTRSSLRSAPAQAGGV